MGNGEPRRRGRKPSAAMRALRGARDLYVRGLRGLDRLLAAAGPMSSAGVGCPTSRVFFFGAGGSRHSDCEEDLRDLVLVRAMLARRCAAAAACAGSGDKKEDAAAAAASSAPPVMRRGATPLQRIDEDAAVVHWTS